MWMQLGSPGPLLRSWQQFLIAQKLLQPGELESEGEVFDAATAAATRAYQSQRGLYADGIVGTETLNRAREDGYAALVVRPDYLLLYGLRSGATEDWEHPAALVHAPAGFDPGELAVVIYLHGINNNIENVVRAELAPGDDRPVADLLGQLARSRCNALLVVPELRFNSRTPEPGRLGSRESLRALLDELFALLPAPLTGLGTAALRRVVVISHSGGYHAAAAMAHSGVRVDELYLLDSLYGHEDDFAAFLHHALSELAAAGADEQRLSQARRFINLYTRGGGTADLSLAQAHKAQAGAEQRQLPAAWVVTGDEPLEAADVPDAKVVIRRVAVEHSELPGAFIESLLRKSGLSQVR